MNCSSCGAMLAQGSPFCGNCGKPVAGGPPAQPQYQAQPQQFGAPPNPYAAPAQGYGQAPQGYGQPPNPYGQQPSPYGQQPQGGYVPQMVSAPPSGSEPWRWHYSRFVGVMYGPIPIGIIGVAIFAAVYYGSR